jgi:hypothetical protein
VVPAKGSKEKEKVPYLYNGFGPGGWGHVAQPVYADPVPTLNQINDIGEKGYREDVYEFVKPLVPPINSMERAKVPYQYNGYGPGGWSNVPQPQASSQSLNALRDINEKGYREDVYEFVKQLVPPINAWERVKVPYLYNGYGVGGWSPVNDRIYPQSSFVESPFESRLTQKLDVNRDEMRPDVYDLVKKSVPAWSYWRSPVPPEQRDDGLFRYDEKAPRNRFASFSQAEPEAPKKKEEIHEPEKVVILQPLAYQERANTNVPNQRTTFYDKRNGIWREQMMESLM